MASSTDKTLGRLSAWSTVVLMLGFLALPFLPGTGPAKAPSRSDVQPPAPASAALQPAEPAKASAPEGVAGESAPPQPPAEVWTEAELAEGLRQCVQLLAPVSVEIALAEPMKKGQCGTPAPLRVLSIGSAAKVTFNPAPEMNCRLAAGLARWVDNVLQPAAREVLGARITRVIGASSYACRNVYNDPHLPLSEHATGNAVDIAGFVTADGRTLRVAKGWGPTERDIAEAKRKIAEAAKAAAAAKAGAKKPDANSPDVKDGKAATKEEAPTDPAKAAVATPGANVPSAEKASVHMAGFSRKEARPTVVSATASLTASNTREANFLKRLHHGACSVFATVLGPEANEAHRDHFHFDMKERKGSGVCH